MKLTELEYRPDSATSFRHLLRLPFSVFLDSSHGSGFAGRYDILTAAPRTTLTTVGEMTEIRSADGFLRSGDDPLELLRRALGAIDTAGSELPFTGGAIGSFAYDLGRRFERLPAVAARDIDFPEMVVGIYDWAYVIDHEERRAWLVGEAPAGTALPRATLPAAVSPAPVRPPQPFEVISPVTANFTRESYARAFAAVQAHIRRGDSYQVNLAQRFAAHVRGDSWNAYQALRRINPAPFSAFLSTPHGDILSSSPERFLHVAGDRVETRPIKGTRPRLADAAADARQREDLAASAKDRAENVMIVDLLRNDLGKACVAGSVEVSRLFEVESFAQVHHLVSTVTGRLAPDRHALDLLRGSFPGGSITGAPKLRAMEIIDALEPERRSIYCGSIGYLSSNGRMDLNVAIRCLLRVGGSIYAWAGGGIVADSRVDAEYQESLDKASGLLAVLADASVSAAS
jgi:para-aminobenzoate synthetase component 1